jgi:PKD repeat protein
VINRTQPEAAFATERQNILEGAEILFTDQSKGGPRQWFWQFEGGIPAFSEAKNPVVKYPTQGVYPVKLKVINEIGTDSIMAEQYINVGVSSTLDTEKTPFLLYPNPAKSDAYVTLKWEASQKEAYKIVLCDIQGQLIKNLYDDRVKPGLNELYFKTTHLNPGTYVLKIQTETGNHRSVKMIILE